MIIRDILPSDIGAVNAISEAGTPGVHSEPEAELAAIARQCSIALVAEIDGVVAGFCMVLPPGTTYRSMDYAWSCERYKDFIYLDRVAVAPAYRDRGIGSRLYEEVERRTTAELFTLEVNLRPRNDGSMRFHARKGFVEVVVPTLTN